MRSKLPSIRYEEIRATVADLIEDWGIAVYPFSVWSLVRRMGIRTIRYSVLPGRLREETGHYWPLAITVYPPNFDPSKTVIFYNDSRSRKQIRFTIAHELAHLALMHPDTGEEIYEHEADLFANYLLVPAPLVLRDSSIDVKVIHDDFQVSFGCANSARDRIQKRKTFGPAAETEYELRILAACALKGGGKLAWL